MPNVKAFDINQWIQVFIGTLLAAAIFGLFVMADNVKTANIERKQDAQNILDLKVQTNLLVTKVNELNQKVALAEQALKILAKTKGMEGMIRFEPPRVIDPSFERRATTYQSPANSDCDSGDCLPPVPPPPPQPEPEPNPTKQ
jgi:hypothetical protein